MENNGLLTHYGIRLETLLHLWVKGEKKIIDANKGPVKLAISQYKQFEGHENYDPMLSIDGRNSLTLKI